MNTQEFPWYVPIEEYIALSGEIKPKDVPDFTVAKHFLEKTFPGYRCGHIVVYLYRKWYETVGLDVVKTELKRLRKQWLKDAKKN